MSCKSCGSSSRYKKNKESNDISQKINEELKHLSFESLVQSRTEGRQKELDSFFEFSKEWPDDAKAFEIKLLVDVFNGDDIHHSRFSPKYCLFLLYKMIDNPNFSKVFDKYFPGLKQKVKDFYLTSDRITLP